MNYRIIDRSTGEDRQFNNVRIAAFLHEHLDEFGDSPDDILAAINYVFKEGRGGRVVLAVDKDELIGAVVLNDTGMSGYIPENILVYIAIHRERRGMGLGKGLMLQAIEHTPGGIALHVEPDNPAVHLYRKLGFTNKYLEMRLQKTAGAQ